MSIKHAITDWLAHGERDKPSEAIAFTALEKRAVNPHHLPMDPSDLRRCLLLLERMPEAAGTLEILAGEDWRWERLASIWDDLAATCIRESGGDLHQTAPGATAPETYRMMQEVLEWDIQARCLRCRRPVNCGEDPYCYCGLEPPPPEQQQANPGYTELLVCPICTAQATREGTDFVCRKRNPSPPVNQQPYPNAKSPDRLVGT